MKNYFENVHTLEDLKKEYRRLARENHPDKGGDKATMQEINAQHDKLFEILKAEHNSKADDAHKTTETPEEFRNIIDALIRLDGLTIELCGSWLWISGDTYTHKEALKAAGCRFSKNKKAWYWRHEEDGSFYHRGKAWTFDRIRHTYGSAIFERAEAVEALPA